MNTSNSPKTHKVAFCTYPKCQTTGMKCTGQCSQANCHVQSVPDGWQLVPTQRLKNAGNLVDRGLWVEGAKVLDDLIASATTAPKKPLTDEQIKKWWASDNGLEDCIMSDPYDFTKVVRAIEAAHNIGEKK